jgi:hypothetical protein
MLGHTTWNDMHGSGVVQDGSTSLHNVARSGHLGMVQVLLAAGAAVDATLIVSA